MVEQALIAHLNDKCQFKSYFASAPDNARIPYCVIYTAVALKERVNGWGLEKITQVFRADIFTDTKQHGLEMAYKDLIPALNGLRGALGIYKDVFITCGIPLVATFDGRDFKITTEITVEYYGV